MENNELATRDEMIAEAIKRLKFLSMPAECISEMQKGKAWFSEGIGSYEMTNETNLRDKIKEFENENNCLVYHAIHDKMVFGECWAFLYVTRRKDEWEYDNDDLKDGIAMSYVWNVDDDFCSEFGSIGVRGVYGALHRTA